MSTHAAELLTLEALVKQSLPSPIFYFFFCLFLCAKWNCSIMFLQWWCMHPDLLQSNVRKRNDRHSSLFMTLESGAAFFFFPLFPVSHWMASTVMDGCQDNLQKTAQFLSLKAVFHNGKRHIGSCFVNCVKCKLLAHFPEPRLTWKLFETTWCLDVTFTQCFNFETYRHIIGFYNPGEMPHLR